jgi:hypothetical protein
VKAKAAAECPPLINFALTLSVFDFRNEHGPADVVAPHTRKIKSYSIDALLPTVIAGKSNLSTA